VSLYDNLSASTSRVNNFNMNAQKEELLQFTDKDLNNQLMKLVNDHKYNLTKQIRAKCLGISSTSVGKRFGEHMLAADGNPVLSTDKAREEMVLCLLQKVKV
jgi:hypothetical protein